MNRTTPIPTLRQKSGARQLAIRATSILAVGALLVGSAAHANPVVIAFEPPQLDAANICTTRAPDEKLLQRWTAWDGVSVEGWQTQEIERDLRRLMEIDPAAWFDTADAAVRLLPSVDPGFDDTKLTLSRIALMVDAGKLDELKNLRLVPELLNAGVDQSPRLQKALSEFLIRGIGIDADPERGQSLLVAAGYGGNADALLELVAMQLAGVKVTGWDIAPEMGVTMAFGALVGQLDPQICDRVTRIAREYKNGDIVAADLGLSERWYRFAADLGDTNAAWKVAEFHLRSEAVVKDNAVLIKYLEMAADGGSAFAKVSLGRIFEIGALAPQDLDRAADLFAQAAASGDRGGLVRNTLFLQGKSRVDPEQRAPYLTSLSALVALDNAPSWAYLAAADEVIASKGRWAGEAEAMGYLEQAAALNDGAAIQRLAGMKMRYATTPQTFYPAVDDLIRVVQTQGKIDPMADLQAAFTCRAPNAPQIEEATYWRGVEEATGTRTVSYGPEDLLELARAHDPLKLARLQSQALSGRASALAQYITLIENGDFSVVQQDFWEDYANQFPNALQSRGRLALKLAKTDEQRTEALTLFRDAVARGETEAGLYLAEALLTDGNITPADQNEAQLMLLPLAQAGNGAAMTLLPLADPANYPNLDAVYAEFREAVDAGGDFDALLIALDRQPDANLQADYLRRAVAATSCNFDQMIRLAAYFGEKVDRPAFEKWMKVSESLAEQDGWRMTQMADALIRYGTPQDADRADRYYRIAVEAGNRTAMHRLLAIYAKSGDPKYDPALSATTYVSLIERSDAGELPQMLARLDAEEPEIKNAVYAVIDTEQLYKTAAEAGDPQAMREYALMLRDDAASPKDVQQSTGWLAQAAELGDVDAMVEYAISLAFGVGVEASQAEALVWLGRAAELGNARAVTLVTTLNLSESDTQ